MQTQSSPLRRRLMWHGTFLFLLGLLTGFLVPALKNPRMGVSAHLEGVMNGCFLLILGLLWQELRFTQKAAAATFWIALYGTYMNWAFTLLGGILGTSQHTPMAGAGYSASALQETFVFVGLLTLTVSMVICAVLVLIGLRGKSGEHLGG